LADSNYKGTPEEVAKKNKKKLYKFLKVGVIPLLWRVPFDLRRLVLNI
jgi:hypothetical protein